MTVLDSARIIVYRIHEKGLEILLLKNEMNSDPDIWALPNFNYSQKEEDEIIWLDDIQDSSGKNLKTLAIEGDWHDIPSIRGMIKHDVKLVKSTIKKLVPQLEHGTYFTIKEAFKKVLPTEYNALKELKDIILDRNLSKSI